MIALIPDIIVKFIKVTIPANAIVNPHIKPNKASVSKFKWLYGNGVYLPLALSTSLIPRKVLSVGVLGWVVF